MPSNENGLSAVAARTASSYPPGIHVPSLTFFDDSPRQEIDWETQSRHLDFLVRSGVHGVVLAGTNGEAVALSRSEKAALVRRTREVAQIAGKPTLPVTLGTSGTSTKDVIDDCVAAKEAGADFVLVLVPSFFHFAMTKDVMCEFFEEVADHSPVPVLIYNFPGVAAGLNVDSTMLERLARHRNIVGVKVSQQGEHTYMGKPADSQSSSLAEELLKLPAFRPHILPRSSPLLQARAIGSSLRCQLVVPVALQESGTYTQRSVLPSMTSISPVILKLRKNCNTSWQLRSLALEMAVSMEPNGLSANC